MKALHIIVALLLQLTGSNSWNFRPKVEFLHKKGLSADTIQRAAFFPTLIASIALSVCSFPNCAVSESDLQSGSIPATSQIDYSNLKVPYNHANVPFKYFLGKTATVVFNMKIDDPNTPFEFAEVGELYDTYKGQGVNFIAIPTEQGWFEPDDDETVRLKAKEFYKFGDYPYEIVTDKIDLLGPSISPVIAAITKSYPTPNGYSKITLNYEKFLLDSNGNVVQRYPKRFPMLEIAPDIQSLINGESIAKIRETSNEKLAKYWREAKKEAIKSEYAFRFNYNYYDAPDSMFKYNNANDIN